MAMKAEAQNVFIPRMGIGPNTGVAVSLHNWGGVECENTAHAQLLADRFDVVASCPSYELATDLRLPVGAYDLGLYQSVFALRELALVIEFVSNYKSKHRIRHLGKRRIYAVGASGGGLVALMMNKLAPQTFAGVFVINPLVSAEGWEDTAGWGDEVGLDSYLIRDVGWHLDIEQRRSGKPVIGIVAGAEDSVARYEDSVLAHTAYAAHGFPTYFVGVFPDLVFAPFQDAGHSLGDRGYITEAYAGPVFAAKARKQSDFERRSEITYPVTGGAYKVKFGKNSVRLTFVKKGGK